MRDSFWCMLLHLMVNALSTSNKALDGPKIEGVSGHLAEHYYLNGDGRTTRMMLCTGRSNTNVTSTSFIAILTIAIPVPGSYYDWLWVRFTVDEGKTEKEYPCCKLLGHVRPGYLVANRSFYFNALSPSSSVQVDYVLA